MSTNKGIKQTFETELGVAYSSDKEGVGCIRHEGDNEFVWLKGVDSTLIGAVVVFWPTDYTATLITNTVSPGARIGVATSIASGNHYGWNQIRGNVSSGDGWGMYCAKRAAPSVAMASCATSGMIDNATTAAQMLVLGMAPDFTVTDPTSGNGVTVSGWMNYPSAATGGID